MMDEEYVKGLVPAFCQKARIPEPTKSEELEKVLNRMLAVGFANESDMEYLRNNFIEKKKKR